MHEPDRRRGRGERQRDDDADADEDGPDLLVLDGVEEEPVPAVDAERRNEVRDHEGEDAADEQPGARFVAPLQNPRASLENFRATRPGGGFGGSSPAARSPSAVSDAMFIKTAQLAPVSSMLPEEPRSALRCVTST